MLTEKEIQIVMNALNGTPTLTTSKFADKIETILRKYKENKFLHHLKSKGYEINGNTAMLLGVKFKICNGTIKTARGLKNSYWLELA